MAFHLIVLIYNLAARRSTIKDECSPGVEMARTFARWRVSEIKVVIAVNNKGTRSVVTLRSDSSYVVWQWTLPDLLDKMLDVSTQRCLCNTVLFYSFFITNY
jgi:hypothetical protein